MLRSNKGCGADLTRSSKRNETTDNLTRSCAKKNRICNGGEPTELSISGGLHQNSNHGVLSELREQVASNLSKTVVSIALFDGKTVLFACSGIPVQRLGNITRFVTSAKLAKAFNDKQKHHDDLKVLVRHEGKVVPGFLGKCDTYYNIAAVNVMDVFDLHTVLSSGHVKFLPLSRVVAVGRDVDGNLISIGGIRTDDDSCGSWLSSTCKISEVYEGGPLFDFDGNFVGINLCLRMETTLFLPRSMVLPWCMLCKPLENIKFPAVRYRDGASFPP